MKSHKIRFRKKTYQGVIYWSYQSDKELNDLMRILERQVREQFNIKKRLVVTSAPIDNEHGEIELRIDNVVYKRYLLLGIETLYLNVDDMIEYNGAAQDIFKEEGVYGRKGVTDISTLEYTIDDVKNSIYFGVDRSPSIALKAAKYWHRTAYYQAFSNGNKRTGLLAALMFLYLNYYIFDEEQSKADLYESISVKIANRKLSEYDVYMFIINNVNYDIERSTKDFIMRGKSK